MRLFSKTLVACHRFYPRPAAQKGQSHKPAFCGNLLYYGLFKVFSQVTKMQTLEDAYTYFS